MRIIYLAKHNSGGNDDEVAIGYSLEKLGHEVVRVKELGSGEEVLRYRGDFLLFHKWEDLRTMGRVEISMVFWYFDLIDYDDLKLERRNRLRIDWMNSVVPLVDLGFCTDGDWVRGDDSGKLVHLLQGADERHATRAEVPEQNIDILFTGISKGGGKTRQQFVEGMRELYGSRFYHVTSGTHQRALADLIARSNIIVAPDSPITDHYWSNRVYLTLGFGGFLLHPYAADLAKQYDHSNEIVFYRSRDELRDLISYYLDHVVERRRISAAGHTRTLREHTYTHRCETLLRTVEERGIA